MQVAHIENIFARLPPNTKLTKDDLIERTGYHERVVRDALSQIVSAGGLPIIDRNGAYWVCTIPSRLGAEINRLRSQAHYTGLRAAGLEEFLIRCGYDVNGLLGRSDDSEIAHMVDDAVDRDDNAA